ncbi:hypothetical protein EDD16DRAFT_1704518 [Pisolithus croceorrhizus]|nr:hypothetical protein EDD16DRAFT_1704518 [Pisolithus croceorrhizus]
MDDLTQAQAALVALEKCKQELLKELHSIQDAVQLQRSIVEELIAQMPMAPIHHLPTESLLQQDGFGRHVMSSEGCDPVLSKSLD